MQKNLHQDKNVTIYFIFIYDFFYSKDLLWKKSQAAIRNDILNQDEKNLEVPSPPRFPNSPVLTKS